MNFRKVKFITSAVNQSGWPEDNLPEIVMIGKSNVGKSTLINLLVGQKIAKVSSSPGHTKTLNFFEIDNKFRLVDAPGHGYAGTSRKITSKFNEMMSEYLSNRKKLKSVIILLDGRREVSQDDLLLYQVSVENGLNIVLVITKSDKLNQSLKAKITKELNSKFEGYLQKNIIFTSSSDTKTITNLQSKILAVIK